MAEFTQFSFVSIHSLTRYYRTLHLHDVWLKERCRVRPFWPARPRVEHVANLKMLFVDPCSQRTSFDVCDREVSVNSVPKGLGLVDLPLLSFSLCMWLAAGLLG